MQQMTRREMASVVAAGIVGAVVVPVIAKAEDENGDRVLIVGSYQGTVWSASQFAYGVPLVAKIVGKDKKHFAGKLGAEVYDAESLTWKRISEIDGPKLAIQPAINSRVRFYLDTPDELTIGIAVEPK